MKKKNFHAKLTNLHGKKKRTVLRRSPRLLLQNFWLYFFYLHNRMEDECRKTCWDEFPLNGKDLKKEKERTE
jgi:hypothetical protein